MKFAHSEWLFGTLLCLVVGAMLIASGILLLRAVRRFGDEGRIAALTHGTPGTRRALKGVLLVLALALAFVAAAQPQYGRGTRTIPATNLDVVIALDFSKSMYARDVVPSRIERAKIEVGRLVSELAGARFAAIAFSGEPISFPLTSDAGAVAQFFRQLQPNDMPVGGTAIGRALEAGREVLDRDPMSHKHRKVIVLITDGEDLEGDPVKVAETASRDDIAIHVVQIGGRTPEPIPEVNDQGEVRGMRKGEDGQPLTTALSAEGEATLSRIAEVAHGTVVRSERGNTGIAEVSATLRRMMSQELSERVETVYADVFHYPLILAILLLLVESLIAQVQRVSQGARKVLAEKAAAAAGGPLTLISLAFLAFGSVQVTGCEALDRVFTRHSPVVEDAVGALQLGDAGAAVDLLETYLSTGKCENGEIGAPESVRKKHHAGFDLGLGLFGLAERFGRRFGEEESDAGPGNEPPPDLEKRGQEVTCALRIVRAIASDPSVAPELQARAHYLAGNLEFLRRAYQESVTEYDQALRLIPGLEGDAGDSLGRDAAHNRAIALRRLDQEHPDAGNDSGSPDGGGDSGSEKPDASKPDGGSDSPDSGQDQDSGSDGGGNSNTPDAGAPQPDAGEDGGSSPENEPKDNDAGAPEPPQETPPTSQDDRVLDMLEQAPSVQEQAARNQALQRRVRGGMVDK